MKDRVSVREVFKKNNGPALSGHKFFSRFFLELKKTVFFLSGQALTPLPPLFFAASLMLCEVKMYNISIYYNPWFKSSLTPTPDLLHDNEQLLQTFLLHVRKIINYGNDWKSFQCQEGNKCNSRFSNLTACQKSLDPRFIVSYYTKCVKTSWTYRTCN